MHPNRLSRPARTSHSRAVESLESRTLLNATSSAAIAPVSVAMGSAPTAIDLSTHFNDPTVVGTAIQIQTPLGNIPLTLLDAQTPKTVANFLQYINAGEFSNVIIHRSIPGFVVQGGGYNPNGNLINQFTAVQGEPGVSNTAGTIAMALSSGPNSGTSQWFINLANNNGTGSTPNLDNTSDGGPFTAFGKVIYSGMSVVNAIAALPTVNDSQNPPGNGIWSNLPVRNYTGSSTPTSVPPANMVTTNTVVVPKLSYTVSSDNPGLVNPSLSGSNLTLRYGRGAGVAHVTVTAKDLGGNTVSQVFAVGVGVTQVTVGRTSNHIVRFIDPDGTTAQVTVGGPGTATINLVGSGFSETPSRGGLLTVGGTPQSVSISTTGTTPASSLNIISRGGGNGVVNLSGITTDAPLRAINARTTDISGNVSVNGPVNAITLGAESGGLISASSLARLMVLGSITSSAVTTAGNIGTVAAGGLAGSNISAGNVLQPGQALSSVTTVPGTTINAVHVGKGGFANSNVVAGTLGNLSLGTIQTSNGGTPFGVEAHLLRSLSGVAGAKHVHLHAKTQADVTTQLAKEGVTPQDFTVRIV